MGFTNKVINSTNFIKIKGLEKASKNHFWEMNGEVIENNVFNGKLTKISPSSYEFEGQERQTIKMLFIDSTSEYYQLDIAYNSISRNILNTLLGYIEGTKVKQGKINLELSLYINKDGYKQIGININGDRGSWKYSIDEQKSMIETITNKKGEFVSNDYSAYDEVLKSGINKIQDLITVDDFSEPTILEKPDLRKDEEISISDIPW